MTTPQRRKSARERATIVRIDPKLSLDQHFAVIEALELAKDGVLFGCHCVADGLSMPCEHVMEAATDKAIGYIRHAEQKSGNRGTHNLRAATDALQGRVKNADDWDDYIKSKYPIISTDAEPGTRRKRLVLRDRIANREAVFREGDAVYDPAKFVGESNVGDGYTEVDYYEED